MKSNMPVPDQQVNKGVFADKQQRVTGVTGNVGEL
jgi:hypothetical protein